VDNPGLWDEYTFKPKFAPKATKDYRKGQYVYHSLPTGARPVPADETGSRNRAGWEFHYGVWTNPAGNTFRSGATRGNHFPESRKGYLDYALLKRMGLTKTRLLNKDAFFFWQLLFPVCDPKMSGIVDDPRLPFYSEVAKWTNKYVASIGTMFSDYVHQFNPITAREMLHFDMAVVRDGVLGGMDSAIYRRWKVGESSCDPEIVQAITHTRWLGVKKVYKLCNNDCAPPKDHANYDPAYKYDYIYKCLVGNTNAITQKAELDLCGDETTCGHGGFEEAGSGILARRQGKPGVTFGMQMVIISDVHRNRIRAYTHRHKVWKTKKLNPIGWNKEGPCELRRILEGLMPMVVGAQQKPNCRQIYQEKPYSMWDTNNFSGDDVMDFIGENGFSATMTCQRNRLPKGVEDIYLHKERTITGDPDDKCARFNGQSPWLRPW
jgi:hypothetical protein